MKRSGLMATGAIALSLIATISWFTGRGPGDIAAAAPPPPQVLIAAAVTAPHAPRATFTGTIAAIESVELKPRVGGYILNVSVPEGDIVRKGQRLFQIDPAPFRARFEAAHAATREAQARLGLAGAEHARAIRLVAEGVAAQERRDQATAALAERQAQLASARAAERLAALDLA